ncbi:hypothetical protein E2C01_033844 [Portunus trituberculatus]|uniref:Uncharacterized protein n=1 Tax=Portunus trituberculatus TaxID=210409 RepID=A0A5B7F412_PORTR|nr:hypothetical protein [Portunus trituberculatus]
MMKKIITTMIRPRLEYTAVEGLQEIRKNLKDHYKDGARNKRIFPMKKDRRELSYQL